MRNVNAYLAEFSAPRHRTIAEVTHEFLEGTSTENEVKKLLYKVGAESLLDIATWADEIKPGSRHIPGDRETASFLEKFPDTREWHFVDLPINATGYDVNAYAPFVREDDVVHMLEKCIHILTGQSTSFSKPNALRWLVHLVGDIHQPLHLACSYIDYSGLTPRLVFNQEEIFDLNLLQKSDRGGNKIILPVGKGKSLHQYWDEDLPKMHNDFSKVSYDPPTPVPIHQLAQLPAMWVSENLGFVKEAYIGLTVKGKNQDHPTYIEVSWDKTAYNNRCAPLIKSLSLKAANRLAFILRTIYG